MLSFSFVASNHCSSSLNIHIMDSNGRNFTMEQTAIINEGFRPAIYLCLVVSFATAVMILRKKKRQAERQFILRATMSTTGLSVRVPVSTLCGTMTSLLKSFLPLINSRKKKHLPLWNLLENFIVFQSFDSNDQITSLIRALKLQRDTFQRLY